VSDNLVFSEPDEAKLRNLKLPVLKDLADLANLTGLSAEEITYLCYTKRVSSVDHYKRFEIPKRKGGTRLIASPKPYLRKAQEAILEEILAPLNINSAAMAYRKRTSIVNNAKRHLSAQVLIRIDLKNFFGSISYQRVHNYFRSLGYSPGISTLLALLTTDAHRKRLAALGGELFIARGVRGLPQGACTSPQLANLIAGRLDTRLFWYAQKADSNPWRYTRYADDLIFSSTIHYILLVVLSIYFSNTLLLSNSL
jgi:retron-type reverse transcriptase